MAKSQYPRGVPFKPPVEPTAGEAVQAPSKSVDTGAPIIRPKEAPSLETQLREAREREARLWRWMVTLSVGTVAVVFLTVAGGACFVTQAVQRASEAASVKRLATDSPPEPRRADEKKAVEAAVVKGPQPAVARPEPAATPAPRPEGAVRERSLEMLGVLTGAHLYQTYLNLGMLADATDSDVYSESEGRNYLDTVLSLMDNVDKQVARLGAAVTGEEDQKQLDRFRQVAALLRTQAREMRAYWETPEKDETGRKDHLTKYNKARDEAWAGIKEMLDLKDE